MPAFIAFLLGGLINIATTVVGRVLIALGLSAISYTGIDTSITWLRDMAVASMNGMNPQVVGLLGVLRVGTCISIISSAYVVRMTLNGLTGGTLKKLVRK